MVNSMTADTVASSCQNVLCRHALCAERQSRPLTLDVNSHTRDCAGELALEERNQSELSAKQHPGQQLALHLP